MGSQRSAITAFVRYYPEIPLISCATIAAILGSIKMLNGDNAEILLSYAGFLCIFYVIIVKNNDLKKSNNFELFLNEIDLVSDYSVQKFNKEFIFYEVLFNGTVQNFINIMKNKKYNLNTQKKVWMIE